MGGGGGVGAAARRAGGGGRPALRSPQARPRPPNARGCGEPARYPRRGRTGEQQRGPAPPLHPPSLPPSHAAGSAWGTEGEVCRREGSGEDACAGPALRPSNRPPAPHLQAPCAPATGPLHPPTGFLCTRPTRPLHPANRSTPLTPAPALIGPLGPLPCDSAAGTRAGAWWSRPGRLAQTRGGRPFGRLGHVACGKTIRLGGQPSA